MRKETRLRETTEEIRRRGKEALRVYRPFPTVEAFHRSKATERIIRGGKRAGKSTAAVLEFASALTGMPIIGRDNHPIPRYYPDPDDSFIAWVIGYDTRHVGETIHRLLFQPGLFRVIWDDEEGEYRIWNPADPADAPLIKQTQLAGPAIPSRLIDHDTWAWEGKTMNVFSSVRLTNGAWIRAYPSTARTAKQGDAVNLIWIDEDVAYSSHVKEYQDRLADKKGRIIWSAWPHSSNNALVQMSARASQQKDWEEPNVFEVCIRFSDNPMVDAVEKVKARERMGSPDEIRARDAGEFLWDTVLMYDYRDEMHGIFDLEEEHERLLAGEDGGKDKLNAIFTKHRRFPDSWTRFLAMDPSHTRTAIVVGCIPPPEEFGNYLILEKELVLERHNAEETAKQIDRQFQGIEFEAFIIDPRISRMTAIGFGKTIREQYMDAFEKVGVSSFQTGSAFFNGSDDPISRRNVVRERLYNRTLRVVYRDMMLTRQEFKSFRKKVLDTPDGRVITDDASDSRKFDCMAAMEYLVSYPGLEYASPNSRRPRSKIVRAAEALKEAFAKEEGWYSVQYAQK